MPHKKTAAERLPVPVQMIERRIYLIRGQKVVLSTNLAELYQVEARALVQAVKRNIDRFPKDFMFQLSRAEFDNLKSQFVTSSWGGLRRATPYAFTQEGVGHALQCSAQQTCRAGQYRYHASLRSIAPQQALHRHREKAGDS